MLICDNDYIDTEVRDHCHITGKFNGFARRDCNTNVKLNHKFTVVIKNYDLHLIMQELQLFS